MRRLWAKFAADAIYWPHNKRRQKTAFAARIGTVPDPLNTEPIGKRSLVNPEEARRWLAGRKGFVPTKECDRIAERPPEFNFELTKEQAELIQREASKTGLSFQKVLETVFSSAYERMQK